MGCCKPTNTLSINKKTEITTLRDDLLKKNSSNKEKINIKQNLDSLKQNREYDENEIPNKTEAQIPSMKIPLSIIQTKKQLQLLIFESKFLQEGKILLINPGGIIGSERDALDGITYFGVNNVKIYLF